MGLEISERGRYLMGRAGSGREKMKVSGESKHEPARDSTTRPPCFFSLGVDVVCHPEEAAWVSCRCSHDPSSFPRLMVPCTGIGQDVSWVPTQGPCPNQQNQGRRPVTASFSRNGPMTSAARKAQQEASWLAPCRSCPAAIVTADFETCAGAARICVATCVSLCQVDSGLTIIPGCLLTRSMIDGLPKKERTMQKGG